MTIRVAVLGSTGSIGTQTLDVIRTANAQAEADSLPFVVTAIGASGRQAELLAAQAAEFGVPLVAVSDPQAVPGVARAASTGEVTAAARPPDTPGNAPQIVVGDEGFRAACADADVVINGIVGFAGLTGTLETLRLGKRLGLANKESLIAAGPVVQKARQTPGAEIIPVDSEHCALHQCLRANESAESAQLAGSVDAAGSAESAQLAGANESAESAQLAGANESAESAQLARANESAAVPNESVGGAATRMDQVRRLLVSASGGPFRGYTAEQLQAVTVEAALEHPTWSMGPKITVDSSTLMNKGLEVIEANELFGVGFDRIDVVVHPQSVVHSMVEFTDGAVIAQLSMPDMRLCMAYALGYPNRHPVPYGAIDWTTLSRLDFAAPDRELFPCLDLAYEAGRQGGTTPAALSAANEVAVEAFLAGRIHWVDIARVVADVVSDHDGDDDPDLEAVLAADSDARQVAGERVASYEQ